MSEGKLIQTGSPQVPEELRDTVTLTSLDHAIDTLGELLSPVITPIANAARSNSVWPLTFGTSCCAIEMMCVGMSAFDISRFGSEVFRATPRQADMILTAGTITRKMAPALITLYEQMPEPKYVIAMGACTITGGMFNDSYSVVQGVDRIIPVDVYLPGCPPRPEAILDALLKLQPQNTPALLNRAIAHLQSGNLERAQADYLALLRFAPDSPAVHFGLGEIAVRQKDTGAALTHYGLYLKFGQKGSDEYKAVAQRFEELKGGGRR